ncbi:MAG: tetratricopeptide repeat protein [Gemmatimonadales bacterium]
MSGDAAERLFRIRMVLFPAAGGLVFGFLTAMYLVATRGYGLGGGFLVTITGGAIGAGIGGIGWGAIGIASRGFIAALTSTGSSPQRASFSRQEALIAQARYPQAADEFRAHLAKSPDDHAARLALADLLATRLGQSSEAERLYRAVVDGPSTDNETFTATNALIDLYRRTGQAGRLMAELARFGARYPGTRAGQSAKRELSDLKRQV